MEAQGRAQRGHRRKRKLTVASQSNEAGGEPVITVGPLAVTTVPDDRDRKVEVAKGSRQIVVAIEQADYERVWNDPRAVRKLIDAQRVQFPQLFPDGMEQGYHLCGHLPESAKLPGVRLRQFKLTSAPQVKYTLRPSFVAPYLTGTVDDLEHPLLLRRYGVPYAILTRIFGHNDMFWYRLEVSLGRHSLVGTTLRASGEVPLDLSADEHHTKQCGEKAFIAITTGGGCTLGIAVTDAADEASLTTAYSPFSEEAHDVQPDYSPATVNTDGWAATRAAWSSLFPSVVLILCFLHGFLKIRDRCRKNHELHTRVWDVFRAPTAAEFRRCLTELETWSSSQDLPAPVRQAITKLVNHADDYAVSYAHPTGKRTSNEVDRLTNHLTRLMYSGKHLHGHLTSATMRLRGSKLIQNFLPFAERSNHPREYLSPAHRINKQVFHRHWLHNLYLSASMRGFHTDT